MEAPTHIAKLGKSALEGCIGLFLASNPSIHIVSTKKFSTAGTVRACFPWSWISSSAKRQLYTKSCSHVSMLPMGVLLRTPHRFSGLAMLFTGTLWNEDDPVDSGSANVTECEFERNSASDGGGMYSVSGYDIIQDSRFEANVAGEQYVSQPTVSLGSGYGFACYLALQSLGC